MDQHNGDDGEHASFFAILLSLLSLKSCNRAKFLKYFSVIALVSQCTAAVLVARYVRTRSGDMFVSSTAVVLAEAIKMVCSILFIMLETGAPSSFFSHLHRYVFSQPCDCLKISVPALIYVAQNNLIYVAVSHLDATTFQVSNQLKILTTALFSVLLLRKRLSKAQWLSLFILFAGVSIVQLQPLNDAALKHVKTAQKPMIGAIAVITAAVTSGFAGVYFEKLLKNTEQSLWVRNLQLSFLGVIFGLATVEVQDGATIHEKGFLFGYDLLVWTLVGIQSFGGLMIALVIKYADNIVKGFANSASIVFSCAFSIVMFDFVVSYQFAFGTILVMFAIYVYNKFPVVSPVALTPSASQAAEVLISQGEQTTALISAPGSESASASVSVSPVRERADV